MGVDMLCIVTVSLSISRLWHCTMMLEEVTTEGNGVKGTEDLPVFVLITTCESIIISKFKKFNFKKVKSPKSKHFQNQTADSEVSQCPK